MTAPNSPPTLQSSIAGFLTPNPQQDSIGNIFGDWWEGVPTVMTATAATVLAIIQSQCCDGSMLACIQNLGGTNAFTAFKIQAKATPNSPWLDYITSAQLNTGTAIAGLLITVVTNPTTLAEGGSSQVAFQTNGAWAIQFIGTSTSGTSGQVNVAGRRYN